MARWVLWICLGATVQAAQDFLAPPAKDGPEPGIPAPCGSAWKESLTKKGFTDHHYAGQGASACVFVAKAPDGAPVAVKISKEKGPAPFREFTQACGRSHLLRLEACKASKELLELHENFLPTCLEVGKASEMPYQIIHAAPESKIGEIGDGIVIDDVDARKALAAQLVGALYAIHHLKKAHNDLHGENIVFDKSKKPPLLAVIDLDEVSPFAEAQLVGYKRDGNAVWRWLAKLAECDSKGQYQEDMSQANKPEFLKCLNKTWDVDKGFLDAMEKVADADIASDKEQHVEGLFSTDFEFVKANLPELSSHYVWKGSEGCLNWDEDKWLKVESEAKFGAHYKCDSVPTYKEDPDKACASHESKAACFSTRSGVFWSCGSGLDPKAPCVTVPLPGDGDHSYDGACLIEGHPGYEFALKWEGVAPVPDPDPDPSETTLPTTTTKKASNENTTTTTTKEEEPASEGGGGWLMPLIKVLLVVAAIALIWFLVKDKIWPPAAPLPEARATQVSAAGAVEMNSRPSRGGES